jgi:DNA topoisomerase VI subunit B
VVSQVISFNRTAFSTDRTLEFFTESELTTQMGYGRQLWPLVIAKELIDNALDACETEAIA